LAVARARLAAAPLDVERKPPGRVAARPGLGGLGHQVADRVEDVRVRGRIAAGSSPDGALVDVDLGDSLDLLVPSRFLRLAVEDARERRVQDVVDEGRLSRARNAGHAGEDA